MTTTDQPTTDQPTSARPDTGSGAGAGSGDGAGRQAADDPTVEPGFEELAAAVDRAVARAAELEGDGAEAADDLRAALEAFHRSALVSIVRHLRDDPRGKELLFELVDRPEVRAVLALHGIIRADPATRGRQALDAIRPYLQSHGGDVELVRVVGPVAEVRLLGSCTGCSMSSVTLQEGVERALIDGVDEIESVEVLADEPTTAFIPLESVTRRPGAGGDGATAGGSGGVDAAELVASGWRPGPAVEEITPGELTRVDLETDGGPVALVATNTDGRLAVFRNACVHQGLSLDAGRIDEGILTCPWHGFTFEADTGECLSSPGARLDQLPARVEGGRLWIRAHGG